MKMAIQFTHNQALESLEESRRKELEKLTGCPVHKVIDGACQDAFGSEVADIAYCHEPHDSDSPTEPGDPGVELCDDKGEDVETQEYVDEVQCHEATHQLVHFYTCIRPARSSGAHPAGSTR